MKLVAKNIQNNDGHLNYRSLTEYSGHFIEVPQGQYFTDPY
jgi:hypothetical protein